MMFDPTVWGTYAAWTGALLTGTSVALGVGYYIFDRRRERKAQAGSVVAWLHPHEHGPPLIKMLNLSDKPIFEYGCGITAKSRGKIAEKAKAGWKRSSHFAWPEGNKFSYHAQHLLVDYHSGDVSLGVGQSTKFQPKLKYDAVVYDFFAFFRDVSGKYWVRDVDRQKFVGYWRMKRRIGKIGSDSDHSRTR
jgi:hypothetical protein